VASLERRAGCRWLEPRSRTIWDHIGPPPGREPLEALELREATLANGELRLVVAYAKTRLECTLPEPKATPPASKEQAPASKGTTGG